MEFVYLKTILDPSPSAEQENSTREADRRDSCLVHSQTSINK